MRLIRNSWVFITIVLFFAQFCVAHDMNIATFQIRQANENQWFYEVMTPLHNLDTSLRANNNHTVPKLDLSHIEYKQAIVSHVKQGFDAMVIGYKSDSHAQVLSQPRLGKGIVKFNTHSTVLVFEIHDMPDIVSQLEFKLANMTANTQQTNIFRLVQGNKKKRYMLSDTNDFTASDANFFGRPKY